MTVLNILTYPDKFLAQPTVPVQEVTEELKQLIEDMADTMYKAPGIGLAANQVGSDKRFLIADPLGDPEKREFKVFINPEIVKMTGEVISEEEGCLSVPDFRADVKRAEKIIINYTDLDMNSFTLEAEGMLAIILQHEIDHLNGILFIDRLSALKKQLYKRKVKKQMKFEDD
ncbi:peptide deformylase [Desulforegula conservatrix]|uniref:peptide deformylase n=1 Tax=Desulforegula conservatrix TaxID=153026 RepID=UPI0004175737|nr:peptide deformylase [Desulforegula conservatrix]